MDWGSVSRATHPWSYTALKEVAIVSYRPSSSTGAGILPVTSLCSPGSAAAESGILSGACILRVGDKDVLKASHDTVVSLVKDSLTRTAQQEGRASIALKFSFGSLEQLASFRYNNSGDVPMDVVERTLESPYTFTLPAQVSIMRVTWCMVVDTHCLLLQLLKMYASEAEQVCAHLSSSKVKETKVLDYVTELKTLAISYKKVTQNSKHSNREPAINVYLSCRLPLFFLALAIRPTNRTAPYTPLHCSRVLPTCIPAA